MQIISFGCGIQSVTMLEMAIRGDLLTPDAIIFADTGWELTRTYNYLDDVIKKAKTVNIPFYVVRNGDIWTETMRGQWPAMPLYTVGKTGKRAILRRQCTMQYKIRPITRKIRELMGLKRYQHGIIPVNLMIGISLDEFERMKDNRVKWIHNVYPLIDMKITRRDCIAYLYKHNVSVPPKSACIGCPYRSDSFWADLKRTQSQEWFELVDFDYKLRDMKVSEKSPVYIHASLKPIDQVVFKDRGREFVNECDGYCGI